MRTTVSLSMMPSLRAASATGILIVEQGWKPQDSLWFYNVTQGSDLLPYDLFMEVEQVGKTTLFRDNANINRYGYLPQYATSRDPDGLPVL